MNTLSGPSVLCIQMNPTVSLCTVLDYSTAVLSDASKPEVKHKRRYCKHQGCTRIVKSQGLCQRHGAKPKKCKIEGCNKQAQGNFDGMCKAHFKALKVTVTSTIVTKTTSTNNPSSSLISIKQEIPEATPALPCTNHIESVYASILPESLAWSPMKGLMPLIAHLKQGFEMCKPVAWHRNEERQVRGLNPVRLLDQELDGWERELAWMETLILAGNKDASFEHLERAWGQKKDFHLALGKATCAHNLKTAPEMDPPSVIDISPNIWNANSMANHVDHESLVDDLIEIFLPKDSTAVVSVR